MFKGLNKNNLITYFNCSLYSSSIMDYIYY